MLRRLEVENYRSLKDISLELGQLTVVTGANGSGKSNLYQSLRLLQAAARGRLSQTLLEEGGMPSALWAGERGKGPVRMRIAALFEDLTYELEAGLVQKFTATTPFVLDPEVKQEYGYFGHARRRKLTVADRGKASAFLTSSEGTTQTYAAILDPAESILSQVSDSTLYPELGFVRRTLQGWRFYHQFDSSRNAPARRPQAGVRVNALGESGDDLAAAIATLSERGDLAALSEAVDGAFPGYEIVLDVPQPGTFSVGLRAPGLSRHLTAAEFSDGQLRFLCLATALLSTRPPELLVLNEPETSLHPEAVRALAPLLVQASSFGQVWITTHDQGLRDVLADHAMSIDLVINNGATGIID